MTQDATEGNQGPRGVPSDFIDATFARRLRAAREQAGMTQRQLADWMTRTGSKMHATAIAKMESGDRSVTVGEAVQLAGIIGVPLTELVTPDTEGERHYAERVQMQIEAQTLMRELTNRRQQLEQEKILIQDATRRLGEVSRRLHELGGELFGAGKDSQ